MAYYRHIQTSSSLFDCLLWATSTHYCTFQDSTRGAVQYIIKENQLYEGLRA